MSVQDALSRDGDPPVDGGTVPEINVTAKRPFPWRSFVVGSAPSVVSGLFSLLQQSIANAETRRNIRQQREWQLEDWRRETDYNSPTSVMARMASAGLNPDLMAGQAPSAASMPSQGSAPAGASGHGIDVSGLNSAVQAVLGAQKVQSEIRVNNANAHATELENDYKVRNQTLLDDKLQKEVDSMDYENKQRYYRALLDGIQAAAYGYVPDPKSREGYDPQVSAVIKRADEVGQTLINQFRTELGVQNYELHYLDSLIEDMIKADREKFQASVREFSQTKAAQDFIAKHGWAQWLTYIIQTVAPAVGQDVSMLMSRFFFKR